MSKKIEFPSVLAFDKKILSSDALFYSTKFDTRHDVTTHSKVLVKEKTVRGTISSKATSDDKKVQSNIQTIECAALNAQDDTLVSKFTVKFINFSDKPFACNKNDFLKDYGAQITKYAKDNGFNEIAKRFAINIANARTLWRNYIVAEEIEIVVKHKDEKYTFNALDFDLNSFDTSNESIDKLADIINNALSGKSRIAIIDVEIYAKVGCASEVFPSQLFVKSINSGKKSEAELSKMLYNINQQAAMTSQKISNALRTIDTFYAYDEIAIPIAIEEYGVVTNYATAYRINKNDFFTLFEKFVYDNDALSVNDKHFVVANILTGCVVA